MLAIEKARAKKFILFTLGRMHNEFEQQFNNKPFSAAITKASFISLARKAKFTTRKARTLYKHLEDLEKRKYVAYANKSLVLTKKGMKVCEKVHNEVEPYLNMANVLGKHEIRKFAKKVQTVLRVK
jgi:DNA topoisomerase IA